MFRVVLFKCIWSVFIVWSKDLEGSLKQYLLPEFCPSEHHPPTTPQLYRQTDMLGKPLLTLCWAHESMSVLRFCEVGVACNSIQHYYGVDSTKHLILFDSWMTRDWLSLFSSAKVLKSFSRYNKMELHCTIDLLQNNQF